MKISLSLQDTNVLKGIALLLLLIHYCLYTGQGYGDVMLMGHPIFQNVGQFSKLCVVMFVFLSGYGLTAKTLKDGGQVACGRSIVIATFAYVYCLSCEVQVK